MPERRKPAKAMPGDIELPNESGKVDPRLPKTVTSQLRLAGEGLKVLKGKFGPKK